MINLNYLNLLTRNNGNPLKTIISFLKKKYIVAIMNDVDNLAKDLSGR